MTKDELVEQVRAVALRLGTTTLMHKDFRAETRLPDHWLRKHFDSWAELCAAAGIEAARGHKLTNDEIFAAMKGGFEAFGGVCTRYQLQRHFRYDVCTLNSRWPDWIAALAAFRLWVLEHAPGWRHLEELETRIAHGVSPGPRSRRGAARMEGASPPATRDGETPDPLPDTLSNRVAPRDAPSSETTELAPNQALGQTPIEPSDAVPAAPSAEPNNPTIEAPFGATALPIASPMVGDPLAYRGIMFAPTNEMGVVILFGAAALELGFVIEAARTGFPDCYAWRRVADGRWKRVRIEFEYASANFRVHEHSPAGCDLIVCWEHNWLKCPVEVFNLKKEIAKLRLKGLGLA